MKLPPDLLQSKAAVDLWSSLKSQLTKLDKWNAQYEHLIHTLCRTQTNLMQCQDEIDTHGIVIEDDKGVLKKNPAEVAFRSYTAQTVAMLKELGLTPVSNRKIDKPPEPENSWEDDASDDKAIAGKVG